jgi:protein dithiol:quinone oxidoreductase
MRFLTSSRGVFLAIFLLCAGFMGYALYAQHGLGLEPCNLCILQRIAMVGLGLVALIAAIHGPRGWGIRVYGGLALLIAAAGAGVAYKHWRIQNLSPEEKQALTCEAPLGFLWEHKSAFDALKTVFAGGGNCGDVDWLFLGLGMPAWVLIWFTAFALAILWRGLMAPRAGPGRV